MIFVITEFLNDLLKFDDWMRIYCFAVCPDSAKLLSIKLIRRICSQTVADLHIQQSRSNTITDLVLRFWRF